MTINAVLPVLIFCLILNRKWRVFPCLYFWTRTTVRLIITNFCYRINKIKRFFTRYPYRKEKKAQLFFFRNFYLFFKFCKTSFEVTNVNVIAIDRHIVLIHAFLYKNQLIWTQGSIVLIFNLFWGSNPLFVLKLFLIFWIDF